MTREAPLDYSERMASERFVLLNDGVPHETSATIDGDHVRLAPEALRNGLGLELKPQGLCWGEACFPVRDRAQLIVDDEIDLQASAETVGRPIAIDAAERIAFVGVGAAERGASLASLDAPDFSLPDLDGRLHALSEHRGKKVLLVAYASW